MSLVRFEIEPSKALHRHDKGRHIERPARISYPRQGLSAMASVEEETTGSVAWPENDVDSEGMKGCVVGSVCSPSSRREHHGSSNKPTKYTAAPSNTSIIQSSHMASGRHASEKKEDEDDGSFDEIPLSEADQNLFIQQLQLELEATRQAASVQEQNYKRQADTQQAESQQLSLQLQEALRKLENSQVADDSIESTNHVQELQRKCQQLQADLEEAHDGLVQLHQSKEQIQDEANKMIQDLLADRRDLQAQLQEYAESSSPSPLSSAGRNNRDAPPETDGMESLRRKLAATRRQQTELEQVIRDRHVLIEDMQETLAERDTSIASLKKSFMTLEQQLSASQLEMAALRSYSHTGTDQGEGYDVILLDGNELSTNEVEELQASLDSYQEKERRLMQENKLLNQEVSDAIQESNRVKSQLEAAQAEIDVLRFKLDRDNDDIMSQTATDISVSPQVQIQERDNAIATLVQQSMKQDEIIVELQSQLADVSNELKALRESVAEPSDAGPSWEQVAELRRETEIFASQVIEQDEEIETLARALGSREAEVEALESQVLELTAKVSTADTEASTKIADLSSKVDDHEETNQQLQEEIRLLTKTLHDAEAENEASRARALESKMELDKLDNQIQLLSDEKANLEKMLADELAGASQVDYLEERLRALEAELEQKEAVLKQQEAQFEALQRSSQNTTVDEMEVESLRSEMATLQMDLAHQTDALDKAMATILELEREVAEKSSSAATDMNDEKEELMEEVESLSHHLEETHAEVKTLSNMVDNYELKLRLIAQDKDVTIDSLNRLLAKEKEESALEIEHMRREWETTLVQMKQLRDEVTTEVSDRDERIYTLQQALAANEDLVAQMKTEMDHLQGGMETKAVTRREEIEDMQQELVDLTTTVAHRDRRIKALQGEFEDKQMEHESELEKLRKVVENMVNATEHGSEHRNAADLRMESQLNDVQSRLEALRLENAVLQEENANLQERLTTEALVATPETDDGVQNKLLDQLGFQTLRADELESELNELKKVALRADELEAELNELKNVAFDAASLSVASSNPVPVTPPSSAVAPPTSAVSTTCRVVPPSPRRQRGMKLLSRGRRNDKRISTD
jgi:chromosome segregation ATPase